MFSDDLSRRSYVKLEEAASFIGLKPPRNNLMKVLEAEGLGKDNQVWPTTDNSADVILPWPLKLRHGLVETMLTAMEQELIRSKSLQSWPCGSVRGGLSPLTGKLTPNCSAPYVDCFVSHDTKPGEHV